MTTSALENNINVLLLLRDHLPSAIKAKKANIGQMELRLAAERAELETLVRHAAVANIPVEDTPVLPLSLPEPTP